MPYRCCVTGCKGNYPTGPKVQVFSFPKDEHLIEKWKRAIPRENLTVTRTTKVCEQHFHPQEIIKTSLDGRRNKGSPRILTRPALLPTAVPSIFPNCPTYLSKPLIHREEPEVKTQKLEDEQVQAAVQERERYVKARVVTSLKELQEKISVLNLTDFWSVITNSKHVLFAHIDITHAPVIKYSVLVPESLNVSVFVYSQCVKNIGINKVLAKVENIDELGNLLHSIEKVEMQITEPNETELILNFVVNVLKSLELEEYKNVKSINFIIEQLTLLLSKKMSYSPEFMIFSCLAYSISPCAYKFNRDSGLVVTPHPSTIQRVCSSINLSPQKEQCENNFLSYVRGKFKFLKPHEQYVNLLIDKIHLKEYFDYKGGSVVGMVNDKNVTANSAQVFMISSILSNFKDVVHILAVNKLTGDNLHIWIKKIILALEDIGFKVLSVISDNNSINRKAMSSFSNPSAVSYVYDHPKDSTRPLFFIIDSVHIMSIWHNWLKQKENSSMIYPTFQNGDSCLHYACFDSLLKLYELEHEKLAKYCYGLTLKALHPNNLEKQNAKLALQIFSEITVNALQTLGSNHSLPHYAETATYINCFVKWWKIVNVKTPHKGSRLNDELMTPLTACTDTDTKYKYLQEMIEWLVRWEKLNLRYPMGSLTKETHSAIIQITQALVKCSEYCFKELQMSYFLPGKFQTDMLEERFGKYRQLCGGQYNVSIRQVYEVEKKLRLQSVIRLNLKSQVFGEISFHSIKDIFADAPNFTCDVPTLYDKIEVSDCEIGNVNEDLSVLTYIAGYCCYSVLKHLKCEVCKDILVVTDVLEDEAMHSLIENVSRGRLLLPNSQVINVVVTTYLIVQKLCDKFEADFLKVANQRELVANMTFNSVVINEMLWDRDCSNHSSELICRKIIWISTNVFLNNYCKKKNQSTLKDTVPRKKNIFCKNK